MTTRRPSPYLTAQETADYLRFPSLRAFYAFLARHAGSLPHVRRGRVLLFDQRDLDAWVRDPAAPSSSARRHPRPSVAPPQ